MNISQKGDEQNPLKYFKSFGDIGNGILLILLIPLKI